MADDDKTVTTKGPLADGAPAVHTDALWDRDKLPDGCLTNIDVTPIPARDMTKAEYFAELNKRGLQMKHQQESTTGPEVDFEALAAAEAAKQAALSRIVPPDPFTKREAELFHAYDAVLRRYGLLETLGCDVCLEANRPTGCKSVVNSRIVRVTCRCGEREYHAPGGTTDLPMDFSRTTLIEETTGELLDASGRTTQMPTILITDAHAEIIRAFVAMLARRRLQRTLYCRVCWGGQMTLDTAILETVTDTQIGYLCRCRLRVYQGRP